MNSGVIFAVLCLFFSGLNDFVFKKYSTVAFRSRGMFVSMIGLFWFIFQMLFYWVTGGTGGITLQALGYALLPGLFVFLSNILLIESMTVLDASTGSTIYRLNTVLVIILSILLLHEKLRLINLAGIMISVIAVLFLFERNKADADKRFWLYLIIGITASVFRSLYAVSSKFLISGGTDKKAIIIMSSLFWFIGGALYALIREKNCKITIISFKYSLISGLLIFMVAVFLFYAIESANISIVIPISNMGFLITYILAISWGIEKLTFRKMSALLLSVIAIIMLSVS
ncbi:MAG: EamA family transporter [Spirochaetia bacterium]|jgi:drug/metabolite transporter (DMT)-like permease|nr:EamA family transporter [Spirochaetia bacterium]